MVNECRQYVERGQVVMMTHQHVFLDFWVCFRHYAIVFALYSWLYSLVSSNVNKTDNNWNASLDEVQPKAVLSSPYTYGSRTQRTIGHWLNVIVWHLPFKDLHVCPFAIYVNCYYTYVMLMVLLERDWYEDSKYVINFTHIHSTPSECVVSIKY